MLICSFYSNRGFISFFSIQKYIYINIEHVNLTLSCWANHIILKSYYFKIIFYNVKCKFCFIDNEHLKIKQKYLNNRIKTRNIDDFIIMV